MKKRLFALVLIALLLCVLVCPAFASSNGDIIVYRTYTGECYHKESCSYLRSSKIEITLADAVSRGLRPCSRCNPPRYTAETTTKAAPEPTTAPAYSYSSDIAFSSIQDKSLDVQEFDMEEFYQKQKQAQAEHEEIQKQIKEMQNNLKTTENDKATAANSGSSVVLSIIFVLLVIWSFIFIVHYVCEKFRNVCEKLRSWK